MQGWSWVALWFLVPALLAVFTQHPWVLGLIVIGFVAQRFLPDPYTWLRTGRRVRALRSAVELNADNVQARRDLAMVYLEQRRPRPAIKLLEEAARREPDSAEVAYLHGTALLDGGDPAAAIERLDLAVRRDPKLRYGDPFLKAGAAYFAIGKVDEAITCLERFTAMNGSSVEGQVRLARARAQKGDSAGRRRALDEAARTFRALPSFQRRRQWTWWLRAVAGGFF